MTNEQLARGIDRYSAEASAGGSAGGNTPKQQGGPTIDPRNVEEVDFQAIVDAIEEREAVSPGPNEVHVDEGKPWTRVYHGDSRHLPRGILPGFGDSQPDCGKPFLRACEHGHVYETARTPGQSTCPYCAPVWARNRAINAVGRLEGFKRYSWSSGSHDEMFLHHVVISPGGPESEYPVEADSPKEAFEEFRDAGVDVLEELGAIGGFLAYHPWSGDHRDESLEDDRGAWKDRLFSERDWEGDVLDELEHWPHLHAVVVAPYIHGGQITKRLEERTGWIVERIADEESGKSIDGLQHLARVVSYTLSHTMLYEQNDGSMRSATRWFGMHNFQASPHIQEAAEKAVHEVAPETLGLPEKEQVCHTDMTDDGLDLSLDIGDGPSSGGDDRGTSGGSSSSGGFDEPAAHRGFSVDSHGDQDESSAGWKAPIPSEGRLEALQNTSAKELIASHEWITKDNVWKIKNNLEDRDPDADLCGETLKPAHTIIKRLDEDPVARNEAEALDEFVENVVAFLQEETIDVDRVQEDVDEFGQEDFDSVFELRKAVEELVGEHFLGDEFDDLRSQLRAVFKQNSRWDSLYAGVGEVQDDLARIIQDDVDDLEAIPSHIKPISNRVEKAGRWIEFDPGG